MARILVVDDEADIREFLELALRRNGHEVKTATRDLEAYAMGVEFRPEVLVIDWMLGASVDGIEGAQGSPSTSATPRLGICARPTTPSTIPTIHRIVCMLTACAV